MIRFGIVASFAFIASAFAQGPAVTAPNPFLKSDGVMHKAAYDPEIREAVLQAAGATSHASNLLSLRNGDLVCIWMAGEDLPHSNLYLSWMKKGTTGWTAPVLIETPKKSPLENPSIYQDKTGRLWVFATETEAERTVALTSTDAGKTWSEPRVLFREKAVTRQPLVPLKDGTWALSVYYAPTASALAGSESHYSAVELSRDAGKTWKECLVPSSQGLVQATILPSGPHGGIAFMRSRFSDWLFVSRSSDGCNWSTPEATTVPNNNASIQMIRLKSGALAIAFNNVQSSAVRTKPLMGARTPLTLALSKDDGATWSAVRDLEDRATDVEAAKDSKLRAEYSYPSIIQVADGTIYVSYSYRRQSIKIVALPPSWIKGTKTEGLMRANSH